MPLLAKKCYPQNCGSHYFHLSIILPSNFNLLILGLILAVLAENFVRNNDRNYQRTNGTPKESLPAYCNRRLWISMSVLMVILIRSRSPHDSFPPTFNLGTISGLIQTFLEDRLIMCLISVFMIIRLAANATNLVHKLSAMLVIFLLLMVFFHRLTNDTILKTVIIKAGVEFKPGHEKTLKKLTYS